MYLASAATTKIEVLSISMKVCLHAGLQQKNQQCWAVNRQALFNAHV